MSSSIEFFRASIALAGWVGSIAWAISVAIGGIARTVNAQIPKRKTAKFSDCAPWMKQIAQERKNRLDIAPMSRASNPLSLNWSNREG